jgi:hypothetical protein
MLSLFRVRLRLSLLLGAVVDEVSVCALQDSAIRVLLRLEDARGKAPHTL